MTLLSRTFWFLRKYFHPAPMSMKEMETKEYCHWIPDLKNKKLWAFLNGEVTVKKSDFDWKNLKSSFKTMQMIYLQRFWYPFLANSNLFSNTGWHTKTGTTAVNPQYFKIKVPKKDYPIIIKASKKSAQFINLFLKESQF